MGIITNMISRRDMLRYSAMVAAAGVTASYGGTAFAQNGPLVLSDVGGEWSSVNQQIFDVRFTERTSVEVVRDVGADNAARIAKIKLGLPQSTYDICLFADSFFARAEAEGLLAGLNSESELIPNIADIDPRFITPNYVSFLFNTFGIGYNPSMVEAPPSSWADLWNPAYKDRIVLPTVNHSFGLHVVLLCGLAASGDMKDIDGALAKLEELAALRPIWALDTQSMQRSLSQGEAAIGWLGRGEHYRIAQAGGETKLVMPKEGGFVTSWGFAPVTNTRFMPEVEKYVNVSLDPQFQAEAAAHWGLEPTNKRWVEFADPKVVELLSGPEADIAQIDYHWLNANRTELTNQWNRIVGG